MSKYFKIGTKQIKSYNLSKSDENFLKTITSDLNVIVEQLAGHNITSDDLSREDLDSAMLHVNKAISKIDYICK